MGVEVEIGFMADMATYFSKIMARLKQLGIAGEVTWKKRIVVDEFDLDTQEPTVTWGDDETIDALIRPIGISEVLDDLKGVEEICRIWTASAIQYLDRIVRGSKIYEVQPVTDRMEVGYYTALLKRLVIE